MKHKKNYFMFNPAEKEPRELTAEEKEKLIKLFNNKGHQAEAIEITKLWLIDEYSLEFEIYDYINKFDYSNKQKQLIFNMYLFLREYTAEITKNEKPDGMDNLEELLFSLVEKGAKEFYGSFNKSGWDDDDTAEEELTEEEMEDLEEEALNFIEKTRRKEDGEEN